MGTRAVTIEGYARLVLISLANHLNQGTGQCNPGQRQIALEAGISPGSVGPNIAKLVALGEVEIIDPGHQRVSAQYRLTFAQELSISRRPVTRGKPGVTRGSGLVTRGSGPVTRGLSRAESRTMNHEPREGAISDERGTFLPGTGWLGR